MPARLLLVTSPLMRGTDVLALQQRLKALGFDPGPLDGAYGPATDWAMRASQAPGRQGSEVGRRALAEARRWLGTAESPPGSNRTPFGAWFGLDGVPWCNIFVSYCFAVGAGTTIAAGFHGAGCSARGCAYVPTTEAWLRATGRWLGRVTPSPG